MMKMVPLMLKVAASKRVWKKQACEGMENSLGGVPYEEHVCTCMLRHVKIISVYIHTHTHIYIYSYSYIHVIYSAWACRTAEWTKKVNKPGLMLNCRWKTSDLGVQPCPTTVIRLWSPHSAHWFPLVVQFNETELNIILSKNAIAIYYKSITTN